MTPVAEPPTSAAAPSAGSASASVHAAMAHAFASSAQVVERRLIVRKGLLLVLATWRYAAAALALLIVLRLLGWNWITGWFAFSAVLAWGAGCLAWAAWKRPGPYSALAFWDKASSRGDAFANAWWFEQQPVEKRTAGQQMHLARYTPKLAPAMHNLAADLPLPLKDVRWMALFPVVALGMLFLPEMGVIHLPDTPLTATGQELAVQEGKKLADTKLDQDKLKSLSEEEKKEVEKLQKDVQDTAKALQDSEGKTARDVLSDLEKRARDAERLAAKLGAGDAAWASEQMVAEMRKHADTAELGDAVAEKSAERTAKQADDVAEKLGNPTLTNETRDRFTETLRDIGKQGQPEDKERTVGQHVLTADRQMTQTLPKEASREFKDLADKMRTLAAREKARDQLEKLAQQLRQSGSDIAGQGAQGMQQLAGQQGQQGQQGPQSQQGQGQMQNMQNAPQMSPMQMPGLSNAPQMQQGQQGMGGQNLPVLTPVPGTGQQNQQPMAIGKPGQGQGQPPKPGQPMLIAPIPGTNPGQQPSAVMLGMTPGMNQGGQQAGNGTTQMGNTPTPGNKAGQQVTVNAQSNADGASSVRAVEGQARNEQASRGAQATALDAIAAEENALDESALPPARREQVRRYFTELRKRFEKE
ncbi:hypothetical protein DES53_102331 [Roseimicrobium gellanilyticum]|uniref:Uncharacterized protein n=1 Tax=Roseimicrobium gellanilyticum TaxID=748857 RepID=A0A366HTC1_9BACT|nr:hypothetical protein [Roseimicrobium gellanilyticum]RBP45947.1 hypothetical protein DES53_102331 [Roseimicrobium gellanilyticum]